MCLLMSPIPDCCLHPCSLELQVCRLSICSTLVHMKKHHYKTSPPSTWKWLAAPQKHKELLLVTNRWPAQASSSLVVVNSSLCLKKKIARQILKCGWGLKIDDAWKVYICKIAACTKCALFVTHDQWHSWKKKTDISSYGCIEEAMK